MQMHEFSEFESVKQLQRQAEQPIDLSAPGALDGDRIHRFTATSCGFEYLYGAQRITGEVLDLLQKLAEEAGLVDQYMAMKSGKVMNRIEGYASEDRQVLHTACRDIFSGRAQNSAASGQAREQLERLQVFLSDIDQGRIVNEQGEIFTTMVQVGIGGSDLGPRALYQALERYQLPGRSARFIANVDPDDAAEVLSDLDLSRTLFNVVSKSGSTLETLTNERLVRNALGQAGLNPARHLLAVTGAGSPMDNPEEYFASFHMFDYIGGRYSATSMVGGVTLGFVLGYEAFADILKGAHTMDVAAESRDLRGNIPLLAALIGIWNRNFLGHHTVAVLPYSQALSRFPAHLQQCDMESNGKSVTRSGRQVSCQTGPVVWGEPGTNGQHAFYQLLHQGTTVVPAEFIGFRHSQYGEDMVVKGTTSQEKLVANMLAQSLALARGREHENPNKRFAGNRPSSVLIADRLTPYTMGALLALYENKITYQGFCWNINSFDQEGVQLGKILANQLLEEVAADRNNISGNLDPASAEYALLASSGILKTTKK